MSLQSVMFPERFKNPARFYTTGRPSYPKLLARRVADLVRLTKQDAVLDLGTGPGFLAIDYAPLAGNVIAIDPAEEMLAAARENAARAQVEVHFVRGSSFELPAGLGPFKLVTMGRSFHWMDREQTLAALDPLLVGRGAIALFGERYPELPQNAWYPAFRALIDSYSTDDPAQPRTRALSPHEGALHAGGFDHLELNLLSDGAAPSSPSSEQRTSVYYDRRESDDTPQVVHARARAPGRSARTHRLRSCASVRDAARQHRGRAASAGQDRR